VSIIVSDACNKKGSEEERGGRKRVGDRTKVGLGRRGANGVSGVEDVGVMEALAR
jgi:hypothetical protein